MQKVRVLFVLSLRWCTTATPTPPNISSRDCVDLGPFLLGAGGGPCVACTPTTTHVATTTATAV